MNGCGLFLAAVTVDHDQNLVSPDGRIAAKIGVVHKELQDAVAHHGLELIGNVGRSSLHTIKATDDD